MKSFKPTRTIKIKAPVVKKINHKRTNGERETKQLEQIVHHIKNNTPQGLKIKTAFEKDFNEKITNIKVKGGRSAHYDLVIDTNQGNQYKVEYKGSMRFSKINPEDKPWKTGVQFSNGNPKSFKLCEIYAREWFNELKIHAHEHEYNISVPPPTFEEYRKDIFKQGKNKNPWVVEFLNMYRGKTGRQNLGMERPKFNKDFVSKMISPSPTDDDNSKKKKKKILDDFKKDVSLIYNNTMKDKEFWLQIHGDINDDISRIDIKWTKGMSPQQLEERSIKKISVKTISPDIKFCCNCGPEFEFEAHLRWGYCIGVGNLRIDLK